MGGDGDLGLLSTKKRSLTAVFNHLTGGPAGLWGQWGAAGTAAAVDMGSLSLARANQEERLGHKG